MKQNNLWVLVNNVCLNFEVLLFIWTLKWTVFRPPLWKVVYTLEVQRAHLLFWEGALRLHSAAFYYFKAWMFIEVLQVNLASILCIFSEAEMIWCFHVFLQLHTDVMGIGTWKKTDTLKCFKTILFISKDNDWVTK